MSRRIVSSYGVCLMAATVNSPGPLQTWIVEQAMGAPAAGPVETDAVIRTLRDSLGVALAGRMQGSVVWMTDHARSRAGSGPTAVWGSELRVDRSTAALVNGTAVQALEFDDIAPALSAHLSSVALPTLAAFADELDPDRAVAGLVAGWRIAAAMCDVVGFESHRRGLQPTHTLGPIVAVIAVGLGLGFTERQFEVALSLSVTGSVGLRANTGTRSKAVQSGLAAAAAVRAIELAWTAPDEELVVGGAVVDSLCSLFGTDQAVVEAVVSSPLPPPAFVAVKPFPTSGAAHSPIEMMLEVRRAAGGGAAPDHVEVRVPPRVPVAMSIEFPSSADEARWSLRYALATAWETGDVDVREFSDAAVRGAGRRRAASWLEIVPDPSFAPRGDQAIVTLSVDGTSYRSEVEHRLGYPERPLGEEQVRAKFDRCMEVAGFGPDAPRVWDRLGLERFAALDRLELSGLRGSG